MNELARKISRSPLAQSAAIHLILLIILALIVIKPVREEIWHSFDWERRADEVPQVQEDAASGEAQEVQETDEQQVQLAQAPVASDQAVERVEVPSSPVQAPALPVREDLIQTPRLAPSQSIDAPYSPSLPQDRGRVVPGTTPQTGSGRNEGYEILEGDGVVGLSTPLPRVQTTDYAVLELSFRLSSDGRIIMSTVIVDRVSTSAHLDATLAALRNWRFRFLGPYRAEQVYRIRFRFSPQLR